MAECENKIKNEESQFSKTVNGHIQTNVSMETAKYDTSKQNNKIKASYAENTCLGTKYASVKNKEETDNKCYKIIIDNNSAMIDASDLKSMNYFTNYLSQRWKINAAINIPICESKKFSINELEMIIHCKTKDDISLIDYPFERIPFLINALDYFTESIDNEQLYTYMMAHVPVIQFDDIDKLNKHAPNTKSMAMDKSWYQFYLAAAKYKHTKQQMHKKMYDTFSNKWEKLPIDILVKMKNISYQILMNTLKLRKIGDQSSNIDQPFKRDCIVTFEFLSIRSATDLYKIWNNLAKSRNYRCLLNILLTVTKEYLSRQNLRWESITQTGQICQNRYQRFIGNPDIGRINDEFIIHTFSILIADGSTNGELYDELCDIIKIYRKSIAICGKPEINTFYTIMVNTFFQHSNGFHPAMMILFNNEYYNANTLNYKFQSLNQEIKRKFVWNSLEHVEYIRRYKNMYKFLIKYNRQEVLNCLYYQLNELKNKPSHYTETIVAIITSLQTILSKNEFNILYNNLVDKYFKIYNQHFRSFIQVLFWDKYFDATTVNAKFQNINLDERSNYLQDLYVSINRGKFKNMDKIIAFFLLKNKHQTIKYIQDCWIMQDISGLVVCFKNVLQSNDDTKVLKKLYKCTIDPYFEGDYKTQHQYEAEFHILCKCFTGIEIANRFSELKSYGKREFIKSLFKDEWLNKTLGQKRNDIGLLLLKNNLTAAQQTIDSWFHVLMCHHAHWITKEFLKSENISLSFLQKMLNKISDLLLTDNVDTIPQEYFDFIDKHAL